MHPNSVECLPISSEDLQGVLPGLNVKPVCKNLECVRNKQSHWIAYSSLGEYHLHDIWEHYYCCPSMYIDRVVLSQCQATITFFAKNNSEKITKTIEKIKGLAQIIVTLEEMNSFKIHITRI